MDPWKLWKDAFGAWESASARYMETVLRNPLVLEPAGTMLTAAMKARAATDKAMAKWWASSGLATRHDQERMLHALNQLQSRLYDLEEQLEDQQRGPA